MGQSRVGTCTHLVTSGPPILSGSSETLGEGSGDRMSNLDIGSPLPQPTASRALSSPALALVPPHWLKLGWGGMPVRI